jgi:hypothetical protein
LGQLVVYRCFKQALFLIHYLLVGSCFFRSEEKDPDKIVARPSDEVEEVLEYKLES